MNEKQRVWFDNVLLRVGLIRVHHYSELMLRHQRLVDIHWKACEQTQRGVPAYTKDK